VCAVSNANDLFFEVDMTSPDETEFSSGDELVPVVYAPNKDDAEAYCLLLQDHGIDATIATEQDERDEGDRITGRLARGIAVLVPEMYLDEASEIIADHDDLDEFMPADELEDDEDEEDDEYPVEEVDEEEMAGFEASEIYYDDEEDDVDEDDFFEDKQEDEDFEDGDFDDEEDEYA
jgi:hypothetical protein